LLLCERAIVEAGTGDVSLIGLIDTFVVPSFPAALPAFSLFLQLTDGIGRSSLFAEIHNLQDDEVVGRSGTVELNWPGRLHKLNLIVQIPPVPVSHGGMYDLIAVVDGKELDRQKF